MSGDVLKNIGALPALRGLRESSSELSKSFERLSSGLRINSAADDSAGLSLANSLRADSRIYTQAVKNVNDGINLLTVAEAATNELQSILTRLSELIDLAGNSVINTAQLNALDAEADALREEYNRVVTTTSYNGISLFSSAPPTITIQAGAGSANAIDLTVGRYLSTSGTASYSSTVGDGTLTSAGTISTGDNPHEIALGDVNGDGFNDLVTADYNDGKVSVYLGNGNGTFKARITYAAGSQPRGLDLYDLNSDGNLDIMVGDDSGHAVVVLLGNSNGSFKAATSYAVYSNAIHIEHADVNADGKMDVITTGFVTGVANVVLGNGDGTFKAAVSYASSSEVRTTAVGDFDLDGDIDFATVSSSDSTIGIFSNNGDGTFKARSVLTSGTYSLSLISGDFNGDGRVDLVNTNYVTNTLSVWLGNGDGTFLARSNYSAPTLPWTVQAEDLNGDGYDDLLFADGQAAGGVGVLLNNGNGTFKVAITYNIASPSRELAIGDLTGDGVNDVVTVNTTSDSLGIFTGDAITTTVQSGYSGILLPDLDLTTASGRGVAEGVVDGAWDLVTLEQGTISAGQSRLSIALEMAAALSVNFATAADRILDVNVAEEVARMVRSQILNQASVAVMAQANQMQAGMLSLLLK